MDIQEFIQEFKEIANKYDWGMSKGTLRGYKKGIDCACCKTFCFCPITAVIREKKNKAYSICNAVKASYEELGMDYIHAKAIIHAADNDFLADSVGGQVIDPIRIELLKAADKLMPGFSS